MKKIGILTSGGDCQGLNAAIRGVAKGLYEEIDDVEIYGIQNGYAGLIHGDYKKMNQSDFSGILTIGGTILGTSRQPFKMMRVIEDENSIDKVAAMKDNYKKMGLDCLVILGGNGTHKTANLLSEEGLNVVTMPKTIDNDLCGIDHCPGFGSAAKYISTVFCELEQEITVYELKNVIIVEMMGRHAGWLTAAAALAEGKNGNVPYLVYLEEKPFSLDRFIDDVKEKLASTNAVLVAVSEGVHDTEGRFLCEQEESRELDVFGHTKLSGTGKILEEAVRAKIGCKVRSIELNLLQRCAGHILSKTDIEESGNLGANAVKLAVAGESGLMSSLTRVSDAPYTVEYSGVDIREVANKEKKIPVEWINEAGNGVKEELITYLTPLVQGEVSSVYENGMPSYLLLK